MSRLARKYHINFNNYPNFKTAWFATDPATITGWLACTKNFPNSDYATLWSFWKIWSYQYNDPDIFNFLYIEWLRPKEKLVWPYGTKWLPYSAMGRLIMGYGVMGLTKENATK